MPGMMQTPITFSGTTGRGGSHAEAWWHQGLRWLHRRGWDVIKILLVVLTTVFFLLQSRCRQSLLSDHDPSGTCSILSLRVQPMELGSERPRQLSWEE